MVKAISMRFRLVFICINDIGVISKKGRGEGPSLAMFRAPIDIINTERFAPRGAGKPDGMYYQAGSPMIDHIIEVGQCCGTNAGAFREEPA